MILAIGYEHHAPEARERGEHLDVLPLRIMQLVRGP
jgi:hypothetical protein